MDPLDVPRKIFIRKVSCVVDADWEGPRGKGYDHLERTVKQLEERHDNHMPDLLHEKTTAPGPLRGSGNDHGRQCCIDELIEQRAFFGMPYSCVCLVALSLLLAQYRRVCACLVLPCVLFFMANPDQD